MTRIFCMIVILLLVPCFSFSQLEPRYEDYFRWFPEGDYFAVSFMDVELLLNSDVMQKFLSETDMSLDKWLVENSLLKLLPAKLRKHCSRLASVQLSRIVISYKDLKEYEKTRNSGIFAGIRYYVVGEEAFVLGIPNLAELLSQPSFCGLEERNSLFVQGKTAFSITFESREKKELFAVATGTDQLLVAESPEMLDKMIRTGNSEFLSLGQIFPFPEILDSVSEFNVSWTYFSEKAVQSAIAEKLEKDGRKMEMADELSGRENSGEMGYIAGFGLNDNLCELQGRVWVDNETAKEQTRVLQTLVAPDLARRNAKQLNRISLWVIHRNETFIRDYKQRKTKAGEQK